MPETSAGAVDRILSREGVEEIRITPGRPVTVRVLVAGRPRHWHAATAETALLLADHALRPRIEVEETAPGRLSIAEGW